MNTITFLVNFYTVALSLFTAVVGTRKLLHLWRTRHLRRVWGIKNRDRVIVVCSELEYPDVRQWPEPREFIYSMKYGDVDAYFESVATLLRLYPAIKLKVISAGEAEHTRVDLARHIVLVGGPDYNALTERVLAWGRTQFDYRSPDCTQQSQKCPDEIVLYDRFRKEEYCHLTDTRDYGYFERIRNPKNPKSNIVLIGGCHTIGVTAAAKAFSMADSEEGEVPEAVLRNAALVSRVVGKNRHFSVLVEAERLGQTINIPLVRAEDVTVDAAGTSEPRDFAAEQGNPPADATRHI